MKDIMEETYKSFLNELKNVTGNEEGFKKMIDSIRSTEDSLGRVETFLDFMDSVIDKRTVDGWEKICKDIHKKNNKAYRIFFLNDPAEGRNINVGTIALEHPGCSPHIQDFLYVLYCHAYHLLYGEEEATLTQRKETYASILQFFEGKEEAGNDGALPADFCDNISNTYNEVLDSVDGMDGKGLVNAVFDNAKNPLIGMFSNMVDDSIDLKQIQSEIEKLGKDDVSSILKDIRTKIKDVDIGSVLSSLQSMDKTKINDNIRNLQESFLSSSKEEK